MGSQEESAMTSTQKHAWFNLAVITLCLLTVFTLVPVLGSVRAQGGFGLLGLLGFGYLFYRKKPGAVVIDERDALIRRRSWALASALFWVAFVLACVLSPVYYGSRG